VQIYHWTEHKNVEGMLNVNERPIKM